MGKLLGAERMALVVLEGEEASMTLRGFVTNVGDPLRVTRAQVVLDTTSAEYDAKLKEFLLRLLSATPGQEEMDAGAADAAKLVAKVEGDGGGEGLDLGDDGGQEPDGVKPADGKTGEGDADAVKAEEQREKAAQAKRVAEEAAREKDRDDRDDPGEAAFTWTYLSDKWWFWTAVGVVVVGAGVGLGVGLGMGGGEDSGGQLVLGLH